MVKIEKKKKKTIPLSKRERKRYVLIEILNAEVAEKDFYFGFWIELLGFFGSRGLAEINPRIVLYKNNKVIVKCKRSKEVELIIDKFMAGKWKFVSFNMVRKYVSGVGVTPERLVDNKPIKLSSSEKNIIKKIIKKQSNI